MSDDSIAVVIPAYNAERFVAEALESVFAQTHEPREVIVVDDGSTDSTLEVVRKFVRATVIIRPHQGVSAARNTGVAASSAQFIAFLDADDTWAPEKLALQLERARSVPEAGIVMARQSYRFEVPVPGWFRGPTDGSSEPGFQPSNWFIRRSAWDDVGPFNTAMTHSEDTDWLARARDLGVQIEALEEPLVVHRIHGANASGLATEVRVGVLQALRDSVHRKRVSE